jgi:hypothetical protein
VTSSVGRKPEPFEGYLSLFTIKLVNEKDEVFLSSTEKQFLYCRSNMSDKKGNEIDSVSKFLTAARDKMTQNEVAKGRLLGARQISM